MQDSFWGGADYEMGVKGVAPETPIFDPLNSIMVILVNFLDFVCFFLFFLIFISDWLLIFFWGGALHPLTPCIHACAGPNNFTTTLRSCRQLACCGMILVSAVDTSRGMSRSMLSTYILTNNSSGKSLKI